MGCIVIRSFNNKDSALAWVQTCASEIIEALDEKGITYSDLWNGSATKMNVNAFLSRPENIPSVILGFGHGNERVFVGQDNDIIFSCEEYDKILYQNNFIYLHSCSCGKELGKKMIASGASGFLGYINEFWFESQSILPFIRTANKGILEMIKSNCNLKCAYDMTLQAYDEEIENAKRTKKFFVYNTLKKNKNAFVKYGSDGFVLSPMI